MKHNSFSRAVYEGQINGPHAKVLDEGGTPLLPVIDVVTLEYPLGKSNDVLVADLPRERTYGVISQAGTLVGKVTDYQHRG